jgi:AraC-like DNA-binding protein
MDFLQSAEVLIPALTGLPVTIYKGQQDVLQQFEDTYCFLANIQEALTAKALQTFFAKQSREYIYEIKEPLGTCLAIVNAGDAWVILGPYVGEPWNAKNARRMFSKLNIAEENFLSYQSYRNRLPTFPEGTILKTAFLLIEHTTGNTFSREVKNIEILPRQDAEGLGTIALEAHEDSHVVNRRYEWEKYFIKAIREGDTQKALHLYQPQNADMTGLRFASDDMRDQLVGATIVRTLVRKAAEQAGLTPILVDEISQDYAVQMQRATRAEELNRLTEKMIIHFCGIIRQQLKSEYSVYIKKATQYIDVNLAKSITTAELAGFVGISSDYFVRKFCQETGQTLKQYIAQRRCEVAKDLLTGSKIDIQEIAAYVGYDDASYFGRVFRKAAGLSPQKYRTSYSQNVEN